MIGLILRILALFAWTVPGHSRDGPPCALVEFAGVKSKPDAQQAEKASSAGVWTLFAAGHILAHYAHGKRRFAAPGIRSLSNARNRIPAHNEIKRGGK